MNASLTSSDDVHGIVFFKTSEGTIPGFDYLLSCPIQVKAQFHAILDAVAKSPPKKFSGGGYWEAMHGEMTGWFEARINKSSKRKCYRLFCKLDYEAHGCESPLLVVIDGFTKPIQTQISNGEYLRINRLGRDYFSFNPRSIV